MVLCPHENPTHFGIATMPLFRFALLAALAAGVVFGAPDEPKKPVPKFKLGKDTTFVDGPLDKDGYIDYEAALNERLKGKITPETNAVVLLMKCLGPKPDGTELRADFYKALGLEAPPEKGEYFLPYFGHFKDEFQGADSEKFYELETRLERRPWKPADSPKHAGWLKLNEKPLAVAVEASRRKDYFHPLLSRKRDGSKGLLMGPALPIVQQCRTLAKALSLRATFKLGEGKLDDAFADALAIHRFGLMVGRGGSPIEWLVGIAIAGVARTTPIWPSLNTASRMRTEYSPIGVSW